jgi:hypothetical protein
MAMWNLNGEDIQRAKEELKGRRAAIQARFDNDMKQLEADIADLETFERFAVKFVTDFKGEEEVAAPAAAPAPAPAPEPVAAAEVANEASAPPNPEPTVAAAVEAEPAAGQEPTAGQRSSSRWRMRLNAGEATTP